MHSIYEGLLEDVSRESGFGETHHSHDVSVTEQMRQNQAIMMKIAATCSLANVNNRLNTFENIAHLELYPCLFAGHILNLKW